VTQISGDSYEGLDGHKGYVLTFTANGKSQKATVTNDDDFPTGYGWSGGWGSGAY